MFQILAIVSMLGHPQYLASAHQFETKQACVEQIPKVRAALEKVAKAAREAGKDVSVQRIICTGDIERRTEQEMLGLDCEPTPWGWPQTECKASISVKANSHEQTNLTFAFDIVWRF